MLCIDQRTLTSALKTAAVMLALAVAGAPAYGAIQTVACNGDTTDDATPSDSKKIEDALAALFASPDPGKTLNLSGTCALTRPVSVQNFPGLSIQGPANLTAQTVACSATPGSGYSGPIVTASNTNSLGLRRLNITGGSGVFLQGTNASISGVNITGSRGDGLVALGASNVNLVGGTLTGPSPGVFEALPNNITGSCNNGLVVGQGSSATLIMLGSITGSGAAGVLVTGGTFGASGCCVVENTGSVSIENNRIGIIVNTAGGTATVTGGNTCNGLTGTAFVRNNQEWGMSVQGPSFVAMGPGATLTNNHTAPSSPTALEYKAGIFASYGSTVFIQPGAVVRSTNGGHAIRGEMQAMVRLGSLPPGSQPPGSSCTLPSFPDAIVRSNSNPAIRLTNMSIGQIMSSTTVNGSGGGAGGDASCDNSSKLVGMTGGIANNNCAAN